MRLKASGSVDWVKKIRKGERTLGRVIKPDLPSMLAAGELIAQEVRKLLNLPGSGIIYPDGHQASAPGEPPARKTGNLADSVVVMPISSDMVGVGIEGADYWKRLEFGTKNIEPRPFVRPALANAAKPALFRYLIGVRNKGRAIIKRNRSIGRLL